MYDPYAQFTKSALSNGLEVHSVFWDRPWVVVEIVVHSGAREDPLEVPGLAHFLEHLVSQNIPNMEFEEVNQFFEARGGWTMFGVTSYLYTKYKFVVPTDQETFRGALKIFGSMLLGARIEKDIERERKVITREFNDRNPFIKQMEWEMDIRKALFKGHRLETWTGTLGMPEGFLSATESNLQSFYDKHYVPANISLVILGGIPTEELIAELENSTFGVLKEGTRNPIPKPFDQIKIPKENFKKVNLSDHFNFKVEQTQYVSTWAFPANFPTQSVSIFDKMLKKILFEEIREKRALAYRISAHSDFYQDVYPYKIIGTITSEATPYIDEVVQECIATVPKRRDLFDSKLEWCKQAQRMVDLSGQSLVSGSADDLVFFHRIITIQEALDELEKVTFDQMVEAASLLSSDRKFTFITCP